MNPLPNLVPVLSDTGDGAGGGALAVAYALAESWEGVFSARSASARLSYLSITPTTTSPCLSCPGEIPSSPAPSPTKETCKNGGFESLGFKNQGQCIKSTK